MTGMGIGSVAMIILLPLFIVIFLFIWSALAHLCLMIVGGANQPFETTFRVLAFTQGSTGPLQIIPLCGGVISGVWAIVCYCIGLARAHETDTGRAVLAVFLPLIVCCGGGCSSHSCLWAPGARRTINVQEMQFSVRRLAPGELDHELIWLSASVLSLGFAAVWLTLGLPWPHCVFHDSYQPAVRHMRNDAMRHPIFSRPFSCRIAMEPIRVRGSLRRHCVRHIRACNSRSAHAATADPSFDAARENIFACLSHLCARAKLDLFAAALAQLLAIKRDGYQAVNI